MEYDRYDGIICKKLFSILIAVHTYYKFRCSDLFAKREAGILSEEQYLKELRYGDYFEDTKKYYNSLCTEELKKLGFTSNNDSFETLYRFDIRLFDEMGKKEYKELVPYITEYLIPKRRYEEIKENLKAELEKDVAPNIDSNDSSEPKEIRTTNEEEVYITISIYPNEKKIFIAEENSSGCEYDYDKTEDITETFENYLYNYVEERINGGEINREQ